MLSSGGETDERVPYVELAQVEPNPTSCTHHAAVAIANTMAAEPSLRAKCVAEFVGTFMLIFTVVCNLATGSPLFGGFSIGTVLFVMIQSFGKVSGGNFNPAVSVALGCTLVKYRKSLVKEPMAAMAVTPQVDPVQPETSDSLDVSLQLGERNE